MLDVCRVKVVFYGGAEITARLLRADKKKTVPKCGRVPNYGHSTFWSISKTACEGRKFHELIRVREGDGQARSVRIRTCQKCVGADFEMSVARFLSLGNCNIDDKLRPGIPQD